MNFLRSLFARPSPPALADGPGSSAAQAENQELAADTSGISLTWFFETVSQVASVLRLPRFNLGDVLVQDEQQIYAEVTVDGETFKLVGFDQPSPEASFGQILQCAHWPESDKEVMRQHRAHVVCFHSAGSDSPLVQLQAAMQLTGEFSSAGLLGMVDGHAWTCIPGRVFSQTLTSSKDIMQMPLGLWAGFVKFFKSKNEVWYASKGLDRWDCPNFAMLGTAAQSDEIFELFQRLFLYLRQTNAQLAAGHTLQIGQQHLRLDAVGEYAEYLESPSGTLVLNKTLAH